MRLNRIIANDLHLFTKLIRLFSRKNYFLFEDKKYCYLNNKILRKFIVNIKNEDPRSALTLKLKRKNSKSGVNRFGLWKRLIYMNNNYDWFRDLKFIRNLKRKLKAGNIFLLFLSINHRQSVLVIKSINRFYCNRISIFIIFFSLFSFRCDHRIYSNQAICDWTFPYSVDTVKKMCERKRVDLSNISIFLIGSFLTFFFVLSRCNN